MLCKGHGSEKRERDKLLARVALRRKEADLVILETWSRSARRLRLTEQVTRRALPGEESKGAIHADPSENFVPQLELTVCILDADSEYTRPSIPHTVSIFLQVCRMRTNPLKAPAATEQHIPTTIEISTQGGVVLHRARWLALAYTTS